MPRWDTVVIGGGLAGVAAAETLVANGKRVLLLEAKGRLGGRVHTERFDEADGGTSVLEKGASYFGPTQPHIRALIARFNAGQTEGDFVCGHGFPDAAWSLNHFDVSAGPIGPVAVDSFFGSNDTHTMFRSAHQVILDMEGITRQIADTCLDAPWDAPPELAALDHITLAAWMNDRFEPDDHPSMDIATKLITSFARTISSCEPSDFSALYFFWYLARCGGFRATTRGVSDGPDSLRYVPGYDTLIDGMLTSLGASPGAFQFKTSCPLTRLTLGPDGVWTVAATLDGEATEWTADAIIMAAPPQALSGRVAIVDSSGQDLLGPSRTALFKAMAEGVGTTLKGFARYGAPWWNNPASAPIRGDDIEIDLGDFAIRYDISRGRYVVASVPDDNETAGLTGYTNGVLGPVVWTMPGSWPASHPDGQFTRNPSLLWFVVGDAYRGAKAAGKSADAMAEMARARAEELLDFEKRHGGAERVALTLKDWNDPNDPTAFGGPSTMLAPGVLTAHGATLSEPLHGIHWACTETARAWGGYMDGAIESGVRAAHEVLGGGYRGPHPYDEGPARLAIPWWEPAPAPAAPPEGIWAGSWAAPLSVLNDAPMAGYSGRGNRGTVGKDRLWARAFYIRSHGEGPDDERNGPAHDTVLCAIDLHSASGLLHKKVVAALARDSRFSNALNAENIILMGTHTHTGPGQFYGCSWYDSALQGVLWPKFGAGKSQGVDEFLVDYLVLDICAAIRGACSALAPADLSIASAPAWNASTNRSLAAFAQNTDASRASFAAHLDDITPPMPADLAAENRAVDPMVTTICAFPRGEKAGGAPLGVFSIFASHATALGPGEGNGPRPFDRDWPGVAVDRAAAAIWGDDALEMRPETHRRFAMANGAAGDISPLPTRALRSAETVQGPALAKAVGRQVAAAVTDAILRARIQPSIETVRAHGGDWIPNNRERWAPGIGVLNGTEDGRGPLGDHEGQTPWWWPEAAIRLEWVRTFFALAPSHPIHIVTLGDHILATAPGEPTVMMGWRLRAAIAQARGIAAKDVLIAGYAGDYAGYFATDEEVAAQHYEGACTLYGDGCEGDLTAALVALSTDGEGRAITHGAWPGASESTADFINTQTDLADMDAMAAFFFGDQDFAALVGETLWLGVRRIAGQAWPDPLEFTVHARMDTDVDWIQQANDTPYLLETWVVIPLRGPAMTDMGGDVSVHWTGGQGPITRPCVWAHRLAGDAVGATAGATDTDPGGWRERANAIKAATQAFLAA